MYEIFSLTIIFIVDAIILAMAIYLFYVYWIKRLGIEIPISFQAPVKNVRKHYQKKAISTTTRDLKITMQTIFEYLFKFDQAYWIKYTGIDGYMYLKYQRAILKLIFVFALLTISIYAPINLLSDDADWVLTTALKNKPNTPSSVWAHTILTILFSCISFSTVIQLQTKFKKDFISDFISRSRKENTEWLKARTALVMGINPNDRMAKAVTNLLNNYLSKFGGKVLCEKISPDYQKMVEIEIEKKNLEDIHHMIATHKEGKCKNILIGSTIRDPIYYSIAIRDLDKKLQFETEKPFLASGYAFVCFDSLENLERCVRHFSRGSFKGFCASCWKSLKECLYNIVLSQRTRALSTFGRFATMDAEAELIDSNEENVNIIITKAPEPLDINWINMKGAMSTNKFRRMLLNIIAILVLFFLTTPTVLFHQIASLSGEGMKFEWLRKSKLGSALASYLPSLLILLLNQILLLLIDLMARWERHSTYSDYQLSMLNKSTPYLIINMLIMPAISMATASKNLIRVIV